MVTPLLEKDIEAAVCRYAREQGCLVYKFTSPSQRAVPDRMFVLPYGIVCFIEFKRPGKEPTALQQRELKKLQEKHVRATWCNSIVHGKQWLDDIIAEDKPLF